MRRDVKTAVIGGGVFGATTAIRLAEAGHAVTLYERLPGLLLATSRNGNRLHMGYHYPRDEPTLRQCQKGYERFKREFGEAILGEVANHYFIASNRWSRRMISWRSATVWSCRTKSSNPRTMRTASEMSPWG